MDLSIVIVNWRSLAYLRECIRSIQANTHSITYEIIVIDNASDDGAAAVIPMEFPEVMFIQSPENLGFAKANNRAYLLSSGQNLLFLNPDTEVTAGAITAMVEHLRQEPAAAIVGPCLLNTDGSIQTSCVQAFPTITNQLLNSALLMRIFPGWKAWGRSSLYSSSRRPVAVDAVSGACLMIRRNDFENAGLFTETYFMYSEDIDLNYKVTTKGRRVDYLPICCVTHHGGCSSTQQVPYFAVVRQKEAVLQFFRRTKGPVYCGAFRIGVAAVAAVRVCLVVMLAPLWRNERESKNWRSTLGKWIAVFQWAAGWRTLSSLPQNAAALTMPRKRA